MTSASLRQRAARTLLLATALVAAPHAARSQQEDSAAVHADGAIPLEGDSTRMRPRRLTYALSRTTDSVATPLGERVVELQETRYGDVAAWSLVERRRGGAISAADDSLLLRRGDLAPLRWQASLGTSRLAVEFARDTMYAALQAPGSRRSIMSAVGPAVVPTAGALERWLEIVTLGEEWFADVELLVVDLTGARLLDGTLQVEGTATVLTPAGEWDCWRVVLKAGGVEKRFWVRRDAPVVVRTHQVIPGAGSDAVESVLVREEAVPPAPGVGQIPPA